MDLNDIKKITLVSDTHMRLSESAFKAICGDFQKNQIYEAAELFDENPPGIDIFYLNKDKLNEKTPDLIIHSGDVGYQEILDLLEEVAPLVAVVGNCDFNDLKTKSGPINDFEYFIFDKVPIAVSHTPQWLESYIEGSFLRPSKIDKNAARPKLRIHGHTHESKIEYFGNGQALICPGSATMGRYGTPNSIANIYTSNGNLLYAELIEV